MAKKLSYLDNLKKEISQKSKAGDNLSRAKYKSTYGVMGVKDPSYTKAASRAAVNNDKARGQLLGALIGKQYNDKTGKGIKK
jgi:hypothetical protein